MAEGPSKYNKGPSKYNPERVKTICDSLAVGLPRWVSAVRAGIDHDTLLRWEHRYPEFAEAIKRAEGEAVARNVALVQRAAIDSWQAAAWWLERRYRDDFGRGLDIRVERERILEDTRKLAAARGLDTDAAVAEVEALLRGR